MLGTLYTRPFNPRSTAILAVAKDLKLELQLETIASSQEASEEYRKINPLAKIPTFVGADGFIVSECIAVAIYIVSQDSNTTLLGTDKQQYASVLQWMSFANTEILSALGNWFNPLIGRQPFVRHDAERARAATLFALQVIENHLSAKTDTEAHFLVGDRPSLADLFVVSIVAGAFRFFLDADWRRAHPACTRWFTGVHGLPIYRNVAGDAILAEKEMALQPPREY